MNTSTAGGTPPISDAAQLPYLDRGSPAWLANSTAVIAELHTHGPLARSDLGLELLGYDICRDVLRGADYRPASNEALRVEPVPDHVDAFLRDGLLPAIDGERHKRIRRVLMAAFGARRVAEQRQLVRDSANRLVDGFIERGRADFVAEFATRYPVEHVARIIGVPAEDVDIFEHWTIGVGHLPEYPIGSGYPVADAAMENMVGYLTDLLERRRREPQEDLVTAIFRAQEVEGKLTQNEMIYGLINLLMAGHDTTRFQISSAIYLLGTHRDQWESVKVDPSLCPNAVDEAMRMMPAVRRTFRAAREPHTIGGILVDPADVLIANMEAANRDPAVFPDPDRFDVTRSNAGTNLTFSIGAHFCLGAHLSRVEQAEALEIFTRRLPDFEIVGAPELAGAAHVMGGPEMLEIEFTPGPRSSGSGGAR